jgi:hypothetical protein
MVRSVEGLYRDGRVELLEPPPQGMEGRVIVTFLPHEGPIHLADHSIGPEQAADLRQRLKTFREHWDSPELDVYNDL